MNTWTRVLILVLVLALLAATAGRWLSPVLNFLNVNSDTIQALADGVQLLLWVVAGLALFLGIRNIRKQRHGGVRAQDITSKKGGITVRAEDGGGVEATGLRAKKDIDIRSSGRDSDPKA